MIIIIMRRKKKNMMCIVSYYGYGASKLSEDMATSRRPTCYVPHKSLTQSINHRSVLSHLHSYIYYIHARARTHTFKYRYRTRVHRPRVDHAAVVDIQISRGAQYPGFRRIMYVSNRIRPWHPYLMVLPLTTSNMASVTKPSGIIINIFIINIIIIIIIIIILEELPAMLLDHIRHGDVGGSGMICRSSKSLADGIISLTPTNTKLRCGETNVRSLSGIVCCP